MEGTDSFLPAIHTSKVANTGCRQTQHLSRASHAASLLVAHPFTEAGYAKR